MFFGCCCGPSANNYWVRKFADESPCNIIAEVDVDKFRDTGIDADDYPVPRDIVATSTRVIVISTEPSTGWQWQPQIWMRHIYDTDLQLIRYDKWITDYSLHHTNGVRLALGKKSDKTVSVFKEDGSAAFTITVGATDYLDAVCLDSTNNLYVTSQQYTGTGYISYLSKWNSSGVFQYRQPYSFGGADAILELECATDDSIWGLSGSTSIASVFRFQPSGSYSRLNNTSSRPFNNYQVWQPLLKAASGKMWRPDTSTVTIGLKRYTTTPSEEVQWDTVWGGNSMLSACANLDSAVWMSIRTQAVVKYTGNNQQEYFWGVNYPSGFANQANICWENGIGPFALSFSGGYVYGAANRTAKLTRRNPYAR